MLTIAILITLFIGFLLVRSYDTNRQLHITEIVGLSFPLGLFIEVSIILLLDYLRIPIYTWIILLANVPLLLLFYYKLKGWGIRDFTFRQMWQRVKEAILSKNIIWLALLLFIAYVEYLNFTKCIYFPTFDNDSLVGFDTIGYLIAQEHTIHALSFFDESYNLAIKSAGSYIAYTPLTQVAYSFIYLFGASTSKLIPALLFLSFLFLFYGTMQREIKATGAMLLTLLMMLTPEMLMFSSMSATNVIHAIYASIGVIYAIKWCVNGTNSRDAYFWSSALLLAANILIRSEGIIFIGAAGLLMLFVWIPAKAWRNMFLWGGVVLLPFFLWKIHQSITGLNTTESYLLSQLFYDESKLLNITHGMKWLLSQANYFGYTFTLLPASCILSLFFLKRCPKMLISWAILLLVLVGYMFALYQVNYEWDSLENVLKHSAKRFIFCFVPIAWYIIAVNYPISWLFQKVDKWLTFPSKNVK